MTTETIKNKSSFNSMIQFAKGIKKWELHQLLIQLH
jgi:hypothetical protein